MEPETRILGIFIKQRSHSVSLIQDVLTKFGCSIRTRLGINVSSQLNLPDAGLILLELIGDIREMDKLENALKEIHQVQVKKMVFEGI
jgi:hypothetical protein